MATNTAGDVGKQYHTDQTHYMTKAIAYTDDGTSVTVGVLPPNAIVTKAYVHVATAFNGGTTNTVSLGYSGAATAYASAVALGTVGVIQSTTLATSTGAQNSTAKTVLAAVTSTASASTGAGTVVVQYIIPGR